MRKCSVYVDEKTKDRLKALAKREGRNIINMLRVLVKGYSFNLLGEILFVQARRGGRLFWRRHWTRVRSQSGQNRIRRISGLGIGRIDGLERGKPPPVGGGFFCCGNEPLDTRWYLWYNGIKLTTR